MGARGKEGAAPLHFTAGNGHVEVVCRLLDAEAFPGHRANATGDSPLDAAARRGCLDVVEPLFPRLNSRQDNITSSGKLGTTPLIKAVGGLDADVFDAVHDFAVP